MPGPKVTTRRERGTSSYRGGLRAEALCRFVLRLKGYRILASRYKTAQGEIDIVACRGRTLAIIEVKARPDEARAGEAVSIKQQKRTAQAAFAFLAHHPALAQHDVRFDVMHVLPWRWPRHHLNAFEGG